MNNNVVKILVVLFVCTNVACTSDDDQDSLARSNGSVQSGLDELVRHGQSDDRSSARSLQQSTQSDMQEVQEEAHGINFGTARVSLHDLRRNRQQNQQQQRQQQMQNDDHDSDAQDETVVESYNGNNNALQRLSFCDLRKTRRQQAQHNSATVSKAEEIEDESQTERDTVNLMRTFSMSREQVLKLVRQYDGDIQALLVDLYEDEQQRTKLQARQKK